MVKRKIIAKEHKLTGVRNFFRSIKLGDFLRNFIAVALGIIITFIGSDIIANNSIQKEIKQAMILLKTELIQNRQTVIEIMNQEITEQKAVGYILKHRNDIAAIPKDSLLKYGYAAFQNHTRSMSYNTLEMFKNSDLIQKIENKELVIQIFQAYENIKSASSVYNWYLSSKQMMQQNMWQEPMLAKTLANNDTSITHLWTILMEYSQGQIFANYVVNCHSPKHIYEPLIEEIDNGIAAIEAEIEK